MDESLGFQMESLFLFLVFVVFFVFVLVFLFVFCIFFVILTIFFRGFFGHGFNKRVGHLRGFLKRCYFFCFQGLRFPVSHRWCIVFFESTSGFNVDNCRPKNH